MKIEHIAMYVKDLERERDFFVTYFDGRAGDEYQNSRTGFRSFFLSFDGGARLELMTVPEMAAAKQPVYRQGYAHIAFGVGSREKVEALTKRLKDDGYEVLNGPRVTGDGYFESSILAIEENLVELTV